MLVLATGNIVFGQSATQPSVAELPQRSTHQGTNHILAFFSSEDAGASPIGNRRTFINLSRKLPDNLLQVVARQLHSQDIKKTYFGFCFPGRPTEDLFWATIDYPSGIALTHRALSLEAESKLLTHTPISAEEEAINDWLQEEVAFSHRITLLRDRNNKIIIRKTFPDLKHLDEIVVERSAPERRRRFDVIDVGRSDFYQTAENGDLEVWSRDGDGDHILALTARKISANNIWFAKQHLENKNLYYIGFFAGNEGAKHSILAFDGVPSRPPVLFIRDFIQLPRSEASWIQSELARRGAVEAKLKRKMESRTKPSGASLLKQMRNDAGDPGKYPLITGTWWNGIVGNTAELVTISQEGRSYRGQGRYWSGKHGYITYRVFGTVAKTNEMTGRLIHTVAPAGWSNQSRSASISLDSNLIQGVALGDAGESHEFTWIRVEVNN